MLHKKELKDLLENKYLQYNQPSFIHSDPISIPHQYSKKEDIEISAFLSATISWGQRTTIIKNAKLLCDGMKNNPHEFILNFTDGDLVDFELFKHRTFNYTDLIFFLRALQNIYRKEGSMEKLFAKNFVDVPHSILQFRNEFFKTPHEKRSEKHLANPITGSAAKRINMFLRWMVRKDSNGIDFGIWNKISSADLYLPLDVHTANVARKLGLLNRKMNDWKAVEELTLNLRRFDAVDPVKYDYALFGLGVFEKF